MNEEVSLITFRAICSFVSDLNDVYGNKYKPLKLYNRLISQTKITHDQAIKKHIAIFHDFCQNNRASISSQDPNKISSPKIAYSDRVYIDMSHIFGMSDNETKPIIWRHILTISALVDPAGKAKDILKNIQAPGKDETDFIGDIIAKVEQNVKPDSNPMEVVSTMMKSGVLNDLMSNMQGGLASGKLDMGKLLGAVQGMVSNIATENKGEPDASQAIGMLNGLMGNLTSPNPSGSPPDMLNMMSALMGGMNIQPDKPE
jgi:hypothetical protein